MLIVLEIGPDVFNKLLRVTVTEHLPEHSDTCVKACLCMERCFVLFLEAERSLDISMLASNRKASQDCLLSISFEVS